MTLRGLTTKKVLITHLWLARKEGMDPYGAPIAPLNRIVVSKPYRSFHSHVHSFVC